MPDAFSKPVPLRLLILGGGAVVSEFYLPALDRLGWKEGITVTDLSDSALRQIQTSHPWVQIQVKGFAEALAVPGLLEQYDAAVVSLPMLAPRNTPWTQLNAWKTSGIVVARRPPKMRASIGTPSGRSQSGSIVGH